MRSRRRRRGRRRKKNKKKRKNDKVLLDLRATRPWTFVLHLAPEISISDPQNCSTLCMMNVSFARKISSQEGTFNIF